MKRITFILLLMVTSFARGALTAHMDATTGDYQLVSDKPAWTFAGHFDVPCTALPSRTDTDAIGKFDEVSAQLQVNGVPLIASIRTYADRPLALFSLKYVGASDKGVIAFPDFSTIPSHTHSFVYTDRVFGPPVFDAMPGHGPVILFDSQANAVVISPASHFFIQRLSGDAIDQVASELNSQLSHIPAGFQQDTLVAVGPGINRTLAIWGHGLTDLQGKQRPPSDADLPLADLGYWTDNGAFYYYKYDPTLGYEGTLLKVADHLRDKQIPVKYMQLDSWWYYKTFTGANGVAGKIKNNDLPEGEWNRYGGLLEYKAHPAVLPDGLAGFQQKLGMPLVTHNRWIDPASPYHQKYKISGIVAIDPQWWHDIMSYIHTGGVTTYEQDWLSEMYYHSPALSSTVDAGDLFLDSMAGAAKDQGMSIQYCMPLPCELLQASKYADVTTSRVSDDNFQRKHWHDFLYVSDLAGAVGIWPWADVCKSTDIGSLLLQSLSGGMVGFGDQMGTESAFNLSETARADGLLVKPDAPIVPLDSTYEAEAVKKSLPLIASTYTDHDGIRTAYVFAYSDDPKVTTVKFAPKELGLDGPVYVFDYFGGAATHIAAGSSFKGDLNAQGMAYYIVASPGKSGIALFGDAGKFVSTGKQRIASIKDDDDRLTVGVLLAAGETSVKLHGCSAASPTVTVDGGTAGAVAYDAATGHFIVDFTTTVGAGSMTVTFTGRGPASHP